MAVSIAIYVPFAFALFVVPTARWMSSPKQDTCPSRLVAYISDFDSNVRDGRPLESRPVAHR